MSSDKYTELKSLITSIDFEYKKFKNKKVKSSGTRVRATLLDVRKLADSLRKEIQSEINAMPKRSKAIAIPKPTALQRQQSKQPDGDGLDIKSGQNTRGVTTL